jgi:hypothetical protein
MVDNSKYTPDPRKFYKTNFVELIEAITPDLYQSEDIALSGQELGPISEIINAHVQVAENITSVLPVSAVTGDPETENLNNISGISQYFVKQNQLTNITPFSFESKILNPLNVSFANFATSAAFSTYLSDSLLPILVPPTDSAIGTIEDNITDLSAFTGDSAISSVHNYLVDALGWFYFLNRSADGYDPSSYVRDRLVDVYKGATLETVDGIKGLTEFLWRNNTESGFSQYIPAAYISGTADAVVDATSGVQAVYTSGTQKLDSLKTMMDVVYSPLFLDQQDYTVKDAFDSYITASTKLTDTQSKGPFKKFTTALGFNYADISDEIENIGLIYDIENVKPEYLQFIADLIGFRLRGNSSSKWRHQLRIAVDLYKKSGTLGAIQAAINALITDSVFDVSGQAVPLWESYIPHLIWYALGTESPLFKDLTTWTPQLAEQAGVRSYSPSSLEDNLKLVTDTVIYELYNTYPDLFKLKDCVWPVPRFYRVDNEGCVSGSLFTIVGGRDVRPFFVVKPTDPGFERLFQEARAFGEEKAWNRCLKNGPLGYGVYFGGSQYQENAERPQYLLFEGNLDFVFNYRGRTNYPLPPFEEVKYYKDCSVSKKLVDLLVEKLKCFSVDSTFADYIGSYVTSAAITGSGNIETLNEWLMFFDSPQVPDNFDSVMLSISDYEKNLLNLFNGKSSHIFIDFDDTDFDFSKTTLEGDGKYALYEAARTAREFTPAHAITRVNLNASAEDFAEYASTEWDYIALDHDDTRECTGSGVIGNRETRGVDITFGGGGGDGNLGSDGGRGGLNTFKRADVDNITDTYMSSVRVVEPEITDVAPIAVPAVQTGYVVAHDASANDFQTNVDLVVHDKFNNRKPRTYQHNGKIQFVRGNVQADGEQTYWRAIKNGGDPGEEQVPPFDDILVAMAWGGQYTSWSSATTGGAWPWSNRNFEISSNGEILWHDTIHRPSANNETNMHSNANRALTPSAHVRYGEGLRYTIENIEANGQGWPSLKWSDRSYAVEDKVLYDCDYRYVSDEHAQYQAVGGRGLYHAEGVTCSAIGSQCFQLGHRSGPFQSYTVGDAHPYTEKYGGPHWTFTDVHTVQNGPLGGTRTAWQYAMYTPGYSRYPGNIEMKDCTFVQGWPAGHGNNSMGNGTAGAAGCWVCTTNQGNDNVVTAPISGTVSTFGNLPTVDYWIAPPSGILFHVSDENATYYWNSQSWENWGNITGNMVSSVTFKNCLFHFKATDKGNCISLRSVDHATFEHCCFIYENDGLGLPNGNADFNIGLDSQQGTSLTDTGYGQCQGTSSLQITMKNCVAVTPASERVRIKRYRLTDEGTPGGTVNLVIDWAWELTDTNNVNRVISFDASSGAAAVDRAYDVSIDGPYPTTTSGSSNGRNATLNPGGFSYTRPFDGSTGVPVDTDLEWTAASNQSGVDIYFGTTNPPPLVASDQVAVFTYDPGTMAVDTWHYWKIIAKNQYGETPGPVASFRTGTPPGPAGNPNPPNGGTGVPVDGLVSWQAGQGASGYDVYIGDVSPPPLSATDVTDLFWAYTDLAESDTYYWKITAKNQTGSTDSPEWSFTTAAPGPPEKVSGGIPPAGAEFVPIETDLSWLFAPGATGYDVYIGNSSPPPVSATAVTDLYWNPPANLANSTEYYWRIDATGPGGTTTGDEWSFTTEPSVPAPFIVPRGNPEDNQQDVAVDATLSWDNALFADTYDVYIGPNVVAPDTPPLSAAGVSVRNWAPPADLASGVTYSWVINSVNSQGTTSGYQWTFQTVANPNAVPDGPPEQPLRGLPQNGATDVPVDTSFSWLTPPDAQAYNLYLDTVQSPLAEEATDLTTNSYTPVADLNPQTTYYWRVDASNVVGATTGQQWSFTTAEVTGPPPPSPEQVTEGIPVDNSTGVSIDQVLAWREPLYASAYTVYYGKQDPPPQVVASTALTYYVPPTMDLDSTYYWRVDASNVVSVTPGPTWSFTTEAGLPDPPGKVTRFSPPDNSTNISRNTIIGWTRPSDASAYIVYFGTDNPPPKVDASTANQYYQPGTLQYGTRYYWRADTSNVVGTTQSPTYSFVTVEDPGGNDASAGFDAVSGTVPRRAIRRRNYKYLLPREGYYDRTGFNGPTSWDPSTLEYSWLDPLSGISLGELTLGFVASANKFHPVVDPIYPSGVWDACENLASNRSFSSIATSATFPYRGLNAIGSNAKFGLSTPDKYVDRGQTPPIYITMHELLEAKAEDHARRQILADPSAYSADAYWKNNVQSLANEAVASGYVLSSSEEYENFEFGKNLHNLYKNYVYYFDRHHVGPNVQRQTGANVFAHVCGSGLYNCNFALAGSAAGTAIATTPSTGSALNVCSIWYGTADGTNTVTGINDCVVPLSGVFGVGQENSTEYRNGCIVSGVELCDISGGPSGNEFRVFRLNKDQATPDKDNPLVENTVIKCKSVGSLPRIRFELSGYEGRRNYFIKDHKFRCEIRALVAEENSPILGGGEVGVWIHTKPQNGLFWTWTKDKKWVPSRTNELSKSKVLNELSHTFSFPVRQPDTSEYREYCLNNILQGEEVINDLSLNAIKSDFFENFTVEFDTRNYTINNNFEHEDIIPIDEEQYKITEQVHTDDTSYVVEVFFLPTPNNQKYMLLDQVKLEDSTLRDWAGIGTGYGVETSGIPLRRFVEEEKLLLSKEQLGDILKFYNGLIGQSAGVYTTALASRDASITSGCLEVRGGSRLNYRIHPEWTNPAKDSTWDQYLDIRFEN